MNELINACNVNGTVSVIYRFMFLLQNGAVNYMLLNLDFRLLLLLDKIVH